MSNVKRVDPEYERAFTWGASRLSIELPPKIVDPEDGIPDKHDPVNYPRHYTWLPKGIEVIDITENFNFTLGNALKYIMRAGHKGNPVEDLRKAVWYLQREIARIEVGK